MLTCTTESGERISRQKRYSTRSWTRRGEPGEKWSSVPGVGSPRDDVRGRSWMSSSRTILDDAAEALRVGDVYCGKTEWKDAKANRERHFVRVNGSGLWREAETCGDESQRVAGQPGGRTLQSEGPGRARE